MGAIGIIVGFPGSDCCEMDFNVAIRTLMVQGDEAVFNVGGGIVYDSDADREYEEIMLKVRPLMEAMGIESTGGFASCVRPSGTCTPL